MLTRLQLMELPAAVVLLTLSVTAVVAACESGTPTEADAQPESPRPTAVEITTGAVNLSAIGQTQQLSATVRDQDGNTDTSWKAEWRSSDEAVASVTGDGTVQAVADGQTNVIASFGSAAPDTVQVRVAQVLTSLQLSTVSVVLRGPTDTASVAVRALDSGGTPISSASVTWGIADPEIVKSAGSGLLLAVDVGMTVAIATVSVGFYPVFADS